MSLEPIAPKVWSVQAPLRFLGVQLGTRMTVVQLGDGTLLLHSPIKIDDQLQSELDALGPVGYIVAPNLFHHLFLAEAASLYPEAKLHGVPALARKRSDIAFDSLLEDGADPDWGGELHPLRIEGSMLEETVLFHEPSRTLLSADLLENFVTADEWSTRLYLKAGGILEKPGLHTLLRLTYRDKKAARRSFDQLLEWPIGPVALAHGSPLMTNGNEVLRQTYRWLP